MMRMRRTVLVVTVLLLPALLAGCNARDWWDNKGTLVVRVGSLPAEEQAVGDFRSVRLAVSDVTAKPYNEIQNVHHVSYSTPLEVDLLEQSRTGSGVEVFEKKFQLRPIESIGVTVQLGVVTDQSGNQLPLCGTEDENGEQIRPCVAIKRPNVYNYDRSDDLLEVKRGGTTTVDLPFSIKCADMRQNGDDRACTADTPANQREYYVQFRGIDGRVTHS